MFVSCSASEAVVDPTQMSYLPSFSGEWRNAIFLPSGERLGAAFDPGGTGALTGLVPSTPETMIALPLLVSQASLSPFRDTLTVSNTSWRHISFGSLASKNMCLRPQPSRTAIRPGYRGLCELVAAREREAERRHDGRQDDEPGNDDENADASAHS